MHFYLKWWRCEDMSQGIVGGSNLAWTVYSEKTEEIKDKKEPEKRRQETESWGEQSHLYFQYLVSLKMLLLADPGPYFQFMS